MRRFGLAAIVGASAVTLCLGAPAASARQPSFVSYVADGSFVSPFLSAACGFPVTVTLSGTDKATVYYDASSTVTKEIDTEPGETITYSANGKSFSFPATAAYRYLYPNGAAPGATASVTVTGLGDKVPGIPADAGAVTYGSATVVNLDAYGVPRVDFGAPTAFSGHGMDLSVTVAAGCAALAA